MSTNGHASSLVPVENKEYGIWGNAGLMRFTDGTLEFMMTVGTPVQFRSKAMIMQKQP